MPHRRPAGHRRGRVCLAFAAAVLLALIVPHRTLAHAFLVSSSPAAGQRLRSSPSVLRLRFTEAVAAVGSDHLTLETAAGRAVPLRLRLAAGGATLVATPPHLTEGIYLVHWQVISADDGHPSLGEFAFAVGTHASLAGLSRGTQAPTDWLNAVIGWFFLLGLSLATGGLLSELVIWRPLAGAGSWQPPRLPIVAPLLLALAGAAGLFLSLAGSLGGPGHTSAFTPHAWVLAIQTRVGIVMVLAIFLLLYALAALPIRLARGGALLTLLVASAAAALRTHPAAAVAWWATPAIVIHVLLAVLWTGMLLQLVLVFWRYRGTLPEGSLAAAAQRYAGLALWSVSLVLLSGLVVAFAEFRSPDQLYATPYGRVLLLKGVLVLIALCLALFGRTALWDRGPVRALSLLRVVTRPEALAAVAILAFAALLSNIAPPYTPSPTPVAASALLGLPPPSGPALTLAGKAGWLEVYVTASSGQLTLHVVTPNDQTPQAVRLHLAAQHRGAPQSTDLFPRRCGPACFTTHYEWRPGTTRLTGDVTSRAWSGGALTFAVPWPPSPSDTRLLPRVIATMRRQRTISVTERTSSSPGRSFGHTFRLSGSQFLVSEPYTQRVPGLRLLPSAPGLRQGVLYLSGSEIWVHLWIDARDRIRREVIVDPGHLIERTFSYPGRGRP